MHICNWKIIMNSKDDKQNKLNMIMNDITMFLLNNIMQMNTYKINKITFSKTSKTF
jgi:hypothetical protein